MGFRSSRRSTTHDAETVGRTTRHQQSTSQRERSTGALWAMDIEQGEQHYGMTIPDTRTLQRLQIAEETYGPRVQEWIAEGMPADILGKTRSMEAFRERQAQRPPAVPSNIERQNRRSVLRSEQAAAETDPAGKVGVPESVREVISSAGRSLDTSVQRAMEDRMGDSLGDVRIHTGPQAAAACEAINARAFTVGNHVAFNQGEYDPASPEGQHVLAHELAHVRQQTQGTVSMLPQEDVELEVDPDPALEREAEETAQRVMAGGELGIQRLADTEVHVQRIPTTDANSSYLSGNRASGSSGPGVVDRVADWMRGEQYEPDEEGVESLDSASLSEPLRTVVEDVAVLKQTVYGDDGIDTKKVATKGIAPALVAGGAGVIASTSLPAALLGAGGAFLAGGARELYGQSIERSLKEGSPFQAELEALESKFNALDDAVGLGSLAGSKHGGEDIEGIR